MISDSGKYSEFGYPDIRIPVEITNVNACFLCRSVEFCKKCHKCPNCCSRSALREGYTLSFWFRPDLTRSSTITSCYVNPHRNLYLLEALHQLLNKNAIELVKIKNPWAFTTGYSRYQNPTTGGDLYWTCAP